MALRYTGVIIGTLTLCQPVREKQGDQLVEKKDEKGRTVYNQYKIQIRQSNALMCAVHVYKQQEPEDPAKPYVHQLMAFFADEQHIKNCVKEYGKGTFERIFWGKLKNIKLNTYYKEMQTLQKYMTKDGLTVQCYYKEPKSKRT